ncbi:hypothetical protein [Paenarthrobacter sp.]|uniref:hypothetical protein n=1 Tax=Paenarthrobacter sp. TaxID=1931993 RepID=UPI002810D11F|nr:hypothetical protein [Paenarthrobacter sp.]
MSAFVVLWLIVGAYQVFEALRAAHALLVTPSAVTVTFRWSFLVLAAANASLGTLYLTGAIR